MVCGVLHCNLFWFLTSQLTAVCVAVESPNINSLWTLYAWVPQQLITLSDLRSADYLLNHHCKDTSDTASVFWLAGVDKLWILTPLLFLSLPLKIHVDKHQRPAIKRPRRPGECCWRSSVNVPLSYKPCNYLMVMEASSPCKAVRTVQK